jgi:hypothetical protein
VEEEEVDKEGVIEVVDVPVVAVVVTGGVAAVASEKLY